MMGSDLDGVLQCGAYFPGTVLDIFRAADANRDGIVSGKEAVDFFMSTGLLKSNLSQVWEAATASQPGGLNPAQFSRALRLVSLLQARCVFSKEFVDKALDPRTGLQLPTPKVGKQFLEYVPEDIGQQAGSPTKPAAPPSAAVRHFSPRCTDGSSLWPLRTCSSTAGAHSSRHCITTPASPKATSCIASRTSNQIKKHRRCFCIQQPGKAQPGQIQTGKPGLGPHICRWYALPLVTMVPHTNHNTMYAGNSKSVN